MSIKCDISKCKSKCCYGAPIPIEYIEIYSDKILNKILTYKKMENSNDKIAWFITKTKIVDNQQIAEINEQPCPFLNTETCKCNIYDNRPTLCKEFGNYNQYDNMLTCFYHLGYDSDTRDFTEEEKEFSLLKYHDIFHKLYK